MQKITVQFPDFTLSTTASTGVVSSKVAVIKAIRILSGLGLKEAKDLSEVLTPVEVDLKYINDNIAAGKLVEAEKEVQLQVLRSNGVKILSSAGSALDEIADDLENAICKAVKAKHYQLAKDISELLLDLGTKTW